MRLLIFSFQIAKIFIEFYLGKIGMYWANFLHIYQPAHQMPDILERVVNESYRPLLTGLSRIARARLTLNVNAVLAELLMAHGYKDVIEQMRELARRGQIEFTESAKYHALLPLVPYEEIKRQIELNHRTNREIFGDVYRPKGFFSPEMAHSREVARAVHELGYEWMILDEITAFGKVDALSYDGVFVHREFPNLKLFFRERRTSNLIMSAVVRSAKSFIEALGPERLQNRYLLTAMDGETFGHHRPGLEALLFEMWEDASFDHLTISELPKHFSKQQSCAPHDSTWSSTEKDLEEGTQFRSWRDPENAIHAIQWEFVHFVYGRITRCAQGKVNCRKAQAKMDEAFASDHFWWASGKPWWSIEMIEQGAWRLLEALKATPDVEEKDLEQGRRFYQDIVETAFTWQRSGYIRKLAAAYKEASRIPFKERTKEGGKPEVYDAFLAMMRRKMTEAVERREFEKAILWRDAMWKLETKNDVYDAIHATDLLRAEAPDWQLKELMDSYKSQYKKMKPGQPEPRDL